MAWWTRRVGPLQQGAYDHRVVLADGKREIWRTVDRQPVFDGFTRILDFYHAAQHLSKAAEHLFGKLSAKATRWYRSWRHKLRHEPGAVQGLIRSLACHRRKLRKGSERHRQVTTEMGYFRNNRDKMDYARSHAAGLILSSGPVEAAAKTLVGHRLKTQRHALDPPRRPADPQSTSPRAIQPMGGLLELVPAPDLQEGCVITRLHPLIRNGAETLGLFKVIKDREYVDLAGHQKASTTDSDSPDDPEDHGTVQETAAIVDGSPNDDSQEPVQSRPDLEKRKKRVFIAHGKNTAFLNPLRQLLNFGELEAVVSTEQPTVAQPVPDKVLVDMRSCGAAILHVDADQVIQDAQGNDHVFVNENVLIEIGASMALYGRRFILLVRKGVTLPSNLQGLFEVRYEGEQLDGTVTISLLEAINDIKNNPLPEEGSSVPPVT